MIRATTLFLLIATAAVAGTLFWLKHVVTGLEDELQTRQQELLQEQEAIHVLKAEWAYLNRPDRLARLAAQYLHLVPVKGVQLTSLSAIPWPLEKTEPRPSFKPGTPAPMPHTRRCRRCLFRCRRFSRPLPGRHWISCPCRRRVRRSDRGVRNDGSRASPRAPVASRRRSSGPGPHPGIA